MYAAAPLAEEAIGDEWNAAHAAGDLPSRALSCCVVFEELGGIQTLRDLQCLDADEPPSIDVVGRIAGLNDDGELDAARAQGGCAPSPLPCIHADDQLHQTALQAQWSGWTR